MRKQNFCAPNEDSNQPANPRNLTRMFVVRIRKLCVIDFPKCARWRFWSYCLNTQADLNLCWAHISEATFPDVATHITKTCLYNFDPLKPHFYTLKLGFTGIYINFLIPAQKHRLWVLVRTASENFPFLVVKFSIYLNRNVFVMNYM